jgi:hypothetical protein
LGFRFAFRSRLRPWFHIPPPGTSLPQSRVCTKSKQHQEAENAVVEFQPPLFIPPRRLILIRYLKPAVLGFFCLFIVPVFAQTSASSFVGTWELLFVEERNDTGDWVSAPRFGESKPTGILMYDDKGNMAVQITTNPRFTGWSSERPEMVNGYVAYYGTYEINADGGTITHHRLSHSNVDVAHLSVVRNFTFSDDANTLTLAPGENFRLTWRKVQ